MSFISEGLRLGLSLIHIYPGTRCAVLNGANEAAVGLFLQERIGFLEIAELVQQALETVPDGPAETLDAILEADRAARDSVFRAWRKGSVI